MTIARIVQTDRIRKRLRIQWVYKQHELLHPDPHRIERCANEVFVADQHEADIDLDTVEDRARVVAHRPKICSAEFKTAPWCWRQYYNASSGEFLEGDDVINASLNGGRTRSSFESVLNWR